MNMRLGMGRLVSSAKQRVNNVLWGDNLRRTGYIAFASLMLVLGIALYPYTRSGFYFDDIFNSELNGVLTVLDLSLTQFLAKMLDLWVVQTGRFFPASIVAVYTFWTFADSLPVYRVLHLGLVVIDIGLFWLLLRKISGSASIANLAVFFLPILLQFNPNLDGVTSFGPLNQGVLFFVLMSWLLLYHYSKAGKGLLFILGLSIFFEMCALTFYEVAVLVIPGLVGIAFFSAENSRRRVAGLIATFSTAFIFFVSYFWFSLHKVSSYSGSEIGSILLLPQTFAAQFFSAFPLALLKNGDRHITSLSYIWIGLGWGVVFMVANIFFALHFSAVKRNTIKIDSNKILLLILALSLAAIPAAVLSISKYHQQIQNYGNPQSVVFIQIFGVALLLALVATWSMARIQRLRKGILLIFIFSLIYALIFTRTVSLNFERILKLNETYLKPRQEMETILAKGLLDFLPEKHLLVIDKPLPWEREELVFSKLGACSAFFTHHAGRVIHCQLADAIATDGTQLPEVPGSIFLMRRDESLARIVVNNESQRSVAVRTQTGEAVPYVISQEKGNYPMSFMPVTGGGVRAWEGGAENRFAWAGTKGSMKFTNYSASSEKITEKVVLTSINRRNVTVVDSSGERIISLLPNEPQSVGIELKNVRFGRSGVVTFESEEAGGFIEPSDLEIKYQIRYPVLP